jgi:3-phenylpropionate/cinnamic acid dioxygenase small subunit
MRESGPHRGGTDDGLWRNWRRQLEPKATNPVTARHVQQPARFPVTLIFAGCTHQLLDRVTSRASEIVSETDRVRMNYEIPCKAQVSSWSNLGTRTLIHEGW